MTDIAPVAQSTATDELRLDRIRRVLEHLKAGTTDSYEEIARIPASEYTDPAWLAAERERIFGAVPSIVAHSSELAKPGNFITVDMPRNKLIVVRQRDGSVKSFVNACRHRGVQLETEQSGKCRLFSCPYHRWSYDTDGSLRTITREETFGTLDHENLSLAEIPTEERHGFIWVIDRVGAKMDLSGWLGEEMDAVMGSYGLDDYVCTKFGSFTEDVNWKILQDAFLDGYHIQYAHPNSAGKYVHTNVSVIEDFGHHARWIKPRKSIDRYVDEDPADRPMEKYIIEAHYVGPNSTLLKQPDHFQLLTFRPHTTDPTKSIMEIRVIAPRLEATDLTLEKYDERWEKNWVILMDVLRGEDLPILRRVQSAMDSADVADMYLGENELANHIFRREILALVAQELP